jgi:hypothetical protein
VDAAAELLAAIEERADWQEPPVKVIVRRETARSRLRAALQALGESR